MGLQYKVCFTFCKSLITVSSANGNNYFTPHLAILFQNLINKSKFVAKRSEYV